jgi:hypothetical protein
MICGNTNDLTDHNGRGCHSEGEGVRAHVLRHDGPGQEHDNMPYDTIIFCDSYFNFESTSARVKLIDEDTSERLYPRYDVKSLVSMG